MQKRFPNGGSPAGKTLSVDWVVSVWGIMQRLRRLSELDLCVCHFFLAVIGPNFLNGYFVLSFEV